MPGLERDIFKIIFKEDESFSSREYRKMKFVSIFFCHYRYWDKLFRRKKQERLFYTIGISMFGKFLNTLSPKFYIE